MASKSTSQHQDATSVQNGNIGLSPFINNQRHGVAILLVALFCFTAPSFARADELQGCWLNEEITQHLQDGTVRKQPSTGKSVIEFSAGKITTTSAQPNGTSTIRYSYQMIRKGVYAATIESHSRADLIGARREYEYKIQSERLYITSNPQMTQPKFESPYVKIESVSKRVPCSSK